MSPRRALVFASLLLAGVVTARAPAPADTPAPADNERGAELFELCAQCHGDQGQGIQSALAPAIAGLDPWYVVAQLGFFRSGGRGDHPQDIPGLHMRPMSRTLKNDEDIQLVAAYVASLPPVRPVSVVEGGDAQRGATHYTVCAQCHGAAGQGNQAMNAPPLRAMSDWYLVSALERYKAGIRGANPKNPNGVMMRGMAMSLTDDQAIKDVVAYIMTFPPSN
jgi:cytochrome c553